MRIAITGSSGLIGTALTGGLRAEGHEVLRLVRRSPGAADEIQWNPPAAAGDARAIAAAPPALEGIDAAVNLAGAPIASGRWSAARKHEIRASRIEGTTALAATLAGLRKRPAALLSGSAIGWYGSTGDRLVDESASSGSGFLAGLARDWEASTSAAEQAGIRVVHLRTGIVLAKNGGMLGKLLPLFRLGLGARLGPATQFMSWIMLAELVNAVSFLLANPDISGPVNLTTPNAVTNADFTAALADALGRPARLRIPAPVLTLALGEAAGDILASARVRPARLLSTGYAFQHADIGAALARELRQRP